MYTKKTIIRYENANSEKVLVRTIPFDTDTGIVNRVFFIVFEDGAFEINYGWTEKGPEEIVNEPVIIFFHNDDTNINGCTACSYIMSNLLSALSYVLSNEDSDEDEELTKLVEYIPEIVQLIVDFMKVTNYSIELSKVESQLTDDTITFPYAIVHKIKDIWKEERLHQTLFLPMDDEMADKNKVYDGEMVIRNDNVRIFYGALPSLKGDFDEFIIKIEFKERLYKAHQVFAVIQEIMNEVCDMIPSLCNPNHKIAITLLLDGLANILSKIS